MSGLLTPAVVWPRPRRLLGALLLAAVVVLGALQALETFIVVPLLPAFETTMHVLDDAFVITDARVVPDEAGKVLRVRANLTRPLATAGGIVYPFGWQGRPAGGFQVTYTVGGVLQYGALMLIVAVAWPARTALELVLRLALAVLLATAALFITVPTTMIAELRQAAETLAQPDALSSWMVWSRLLMGGGGLAGSLVLAALAVIAARRLADAVARARRLS